jgi:hypothetical protein
MKITLLLASWILISWNYIIETRKEHIMRAKSNSLVVLVAAFSLMPFLGCSDKEEQTREDAIETDSSGQISAEMAQNQPDEDAGIPVAVEDISLNDVVALWDNGKKDEATAKFLSVNWKNPSVFNEMSCFDLSERQFGWNSRKERERIMEEYSNLRDKLLVGVVRYVRSAGDSVLASGDEQTAREYYSGILRCGQALSSPNRLALIQLDGKAIVKMAQDRLSSLE